MGCLWWVGSIKLYVSFAKEPYKRDHILQKSPISAVAGRQHLDLHTHTHTANCRQGGIESWDSFLNSQFCTRHTKILMGITYEWGGTHMNESWHTYEWVMAHRRHIWMSHGTHMNESWHTYEWVMAHGRHIWMSHGTHEWVMAHTWMCHGTHMNAGVPIFSWD